MPDVTINRTQASQTTTPPTTAAPVKKAPGKFGRIMCALAGGALNVVAPGAGTLVGELAGGGADPLADMQSVLAENQQSMSRMFAVQNEVQNQTQTFTLLTNIMKAKHDAEMAAVHNLKS
jgi:predicted lipid-binding transport protein (Tim44 family)